MVSIRDQARTIAFIGGGGKTTLSLALALTLPGRIALSTTTRMFAPASLPVLFNAATDDVRAAWEQTPALCVVGGTLPKVYPPTGEMLSFLARNADRLILEADGAKHRPLKIHRDYEPVVPPYADLVLCVAGLHALGLPLGEAVHRAEDVEAFYQKPASSPVTEEDVALSVARNAAGRENAVAVLNRVTDEAAARRIAAILTGRYRLPCLLVPELPDDGGRNLRIRDALLSPWLI